MTIYQDLPNLRIVSVKSLLLHEVHDNRRVSRLKKEFIKQKILNNPPIVAKIPNTKNYIVLDGANRVTCFRELGYPHIVVQIVDYLNHKIQQKTWNHLICNLTQEERILISNLVKNSEFARMKNDNVILIKKIDKKRLNEQLEFIDNLFNKYQTKEFYRIMGNGIRNFYKKYKNVSFLVVYPKLTPKKIIYITKNNFKIPSGITRHIIPNRALGINIKLNMLKSKKSLNIKNKYLYELINKRLLAHKIRHYKEPVVIFND